MYFSKSPITPGKEDPSRFAGAFGPSDHIYGVLYLKASPRELFEIEDRSQLNPAAASKYAYYYVITIDGDVSTTRRFECPITHAELLRDRKSVRLDLLAAPEHSRSFNNREWANALSGLPSGKHRIKIDMESWGAGELEVDTTGWDEKARRREAQEADMHAIENNVPGRGEIAFGRFQGATRFYGDRELSTEKLAAAFQKAYGARCAEVVRVIVMADAEDDWKVIKDGFGHAVRREPAGTLAFVYKTPAGAYFCSTRKPVSQRLDGGDYGPLVFPTATPGAPADVPVGAADVAALAE